MGDKYEQYNYFLEASPPQRGHQLWHSLLMNPFQLFMLLFSVFLGGGGMEGAFAKTKYRFIPIVVPKDVNFERVWT